MNDSIFTKIIKGEISAHKIYEDENTLAFLDIHPAAEGHTLVIPKKQVEFVWDLKDDDYQNLMVTVKKVALHLRKVSQKPYVGITVVGTDVPHAHVHVVPFDSPQSIKAVASMTDRDKIVPDHVALAKLAEKLHL